MSNNENLKRFRFHFGKNKAMQYTGHLDLHRTMERTFRRANLPLAYSQGFNPHPRITLAVTLPLGCTSSHEIIDFWLKESLPIEDIEIKLKNALPPGIDFSKIEEISLQAPKPQKIVVSALFTVLLKEKDANIAQKVADFMQSEEIWIDKKRKGKIKQVNIRPLVLDMTVMEDGNRIQMTLPTLPSATGRADDVMRAMDIAINQIRIHREKINLSE